MIHTAQAQTVETDKPTGVYIWKLNSPKYNECKKSNGLAYEDCYNNPAVIAANYAEFDRQATQKLTPQQTTLLRKIGSCEAGFQMKPNSTGVSSAYGIFQELKIHDKRAAKMGVCRYTAQGNIALGIEIFLEQGTAPWVSSKHCWNK